MAISQLLGQALAYACAKKMLTHQCQGCGILLHLNRFGSIFGNLDLAAFSCIFFRNPR